MAFDPALHTASNKPYASWGTPTDARYWYYDDSIFTYRPYNSTSEVLSYLVGDDARAGAVTVQVLVTGVLREYWFRDGTADGDLIAKTPELTWDSGTGDLGLLGGASVNLDGRYSLIGHTHPISDITGLQTALDSKMNRSNTITSGYGILASPDFSGPVSIELNTSVVDNRYLRKDVSDNNGANTLTLGALVAGNTTINGTLNATSLAAGLITDQMLVRDASTGAVKYLAMPSFGGAFNVANGAGANQFSVDSGQQLQFVGTGDSSVAFATVSPGVYRITINSTGGSTGGGVDSWNARTGHVVPESGDYTTAQVTESGNLYFTTSRVLSTALTGYTAGSNTAILDTDTILQAFGKTQGQINARANSATTLEVVGTAGNIVVSGGAQSLAANRTWTVNLVAGIVTAGTYTKVTVDTFGRVTAGAALIAADIPNLDASKITSGTFNVARLGSGTSGSGTYLQGNGQWTAFPAITSGTVTSVALSMPGIFNVSGSPVTSSGTLTAALATQAMNLVFAGPPSGSAAAPTFRALVANDIPNLDAAKITTGTIATARLGSGTANAGAYLAGDQTWKVMPTPATGTVTSVAISSTDLSVSGSPITSAGTINLNIGTNAVTFSKIQQIPTQTLLGRYATGTGNVQSITLGTNLTLNSSTGVLSAASSVYTAGGGIGLSGNQFSVSAGTGLIQEANGLRVDPALLAGYVLKAGDTMTGPLTISTGSSGLRLRSSHGLDGNNWITFNDLVNSENAWIGYGGANWNLSITNNRGDVWLQNKIQVTSSDIIHHYNTVLYGGLIGYDLIRGLKGAVPSSTAYGSGNFLASILQNEHESGKRPGYGFLSDNYFGIYLYANNAASLRFVNSGGQDYELYHTGNLPPYPTDYVTISTSQTITGNKEFNGRVVGTRSISPLNAGSYSENNFEAMISESQWNSGHRPGFGFHAANVLGLFLYAKDGNNIGLYSSGTADYTIYHTGNLNIGNFLAAGSAIGNYLGVQGGDANDLRSVATYASSMSNVPENGHILSLRVSPTYGFQTWAQYAGDDYRIRTLADGTWGTWKRIWHSGNFPYAPSSPSVGQILQYNGTNWVNANAPSTGVTSVGMTIAGSALSVTPATITSVGTFAVTWGGSSSQYVAGNGSLVTFPTIPTYAGSASIINVSGNFQRAALTGDVTSPQNSNTLTIGDGAVTTSKIADYNVTVAKMQQIGSSELVRGALVGYNQGGSVRDAVLLIPGSNMTIVGGILNINTFTRVAPGTVPAPGGAPGGDTRFLREDGSWVVPTGGGGGGTATDLSLGTLTNTTVTVNSSTGTAVTLPAPTSITAGVMSADNWVVLNNIPQASLLGRYSSGTGNAQYITLGAGLNITPSGVLEVTGGGSGGSYTAGEGLDLSSNQFSLEPITAGSTATGAIRYSGTTKTAGQWYGGTTNPSDGARLNYDGVLYANGLFANTGQFLTSLYGGSIRSGVYSIGAGTSISWANGGTQYASLSANRSFTVTMNSGEFMDVEIVNTAGTTVTMSFSGATLPDSVNGQIPAGKTAVFSFKRFNNSNPARVTKVIF